MEKIASEAMKAVPHIINIRAKHLWIDYDEEADVLYISFEKPQQAADSELREDNILIRRQKDGKIVGMTVLNASRYKAH